MKSTKKVTVDAAVREPSKLSTYSAPPPPVPTEPTQISPKAVKLTQKGVDQPILPPNWKAATDEDGATYFFNSVTKKTQWNPPTISVLQDTSTAGEGDETPRL
mmetsp:Transcript_26141/g.40914  ORF Transcript_26141/g.40914 Transcript_26141/m.40914 type:complete len:103 (+) Transcript_26141:105-413(+)